MGDLSSLLSVNSFYHKMSGEQVRHGASTTLRRAKSNRRCWRFQYFTSNPAIDVSSMPGISYAIWQELKCGPMRSVIYCYVQFTKRVYLTQVKRLLPLANWEFASRRSREEQNRCCRSEGCLRGPFEIGTISEQGVKRKQPDTETVEL